LRDLGAELPSPLPEVPNKVDLEDLQRELRSLGKRLQAMEPVNMLALEEFDKVQGRGAYTQVLGIKLQSSDH